MRQFPKLNEAVDSRDPTIGLTAVAALRDLVEELEELHVDNARQLGWSWQAIADGLGITRQSVRKRSTTFVEDAGIKPYSIAATRTP